MKQLLFINQTLDVGGAEIFHADLLAAFQEKNLQVTAFVTTKKYVILLEKSGIKVSEIPIILDLVGDWKGLFKAFFLWPFAVMYYWNVVSKNKNADAVLLSSFTEKILVSPIAAIHHIPVFWIEFGPVEGILRRFFSFPKFLYNCVSSIPKKVVVPSLHTKKHLLLETRITESQLVRIPCGRSISEEQFKKYQSVTKVPNQVVCVSRLEKGKGQDLLIEAFAKVVTKIPEAKLLLTGNSSWKLELEKLVEKLELSDSVEFKGWVDDPLALMAESTVCVFPSMWELEGFGLVMIEAMALGKVVVAFDFGAAPEVIEDGKTGLLVKAGSVDDLADVIVSVLRSESMQKTISLAARKQFVEKYQISSVANSFEKLFL